MLESGRLRHRVRIERYELARDTNGEVIQDEQTGQTVGSWVEVATVWAAIEPLSVREFTAAQATQSRIDTRIVMRQRDDVDAAMRLVHIRAGGVAGTIYNPAGFLADKDSGLEYMTIPASSGVSVTGQ